MKILKNPIFMFILGGIILSSVTYAATKVEADKIEYSENVSVKDKIDDLYSKTVDYKKLDTATTATANDILDGKTAYSSNGTLIEGSASAASLSNITHFYTNKSAGNLSASRSLSTNTLSTGKYIVSVSYAMAGSSSEQINYTFINNSDVVITSATCSNCNYTKLASFGYDKTPSNLEAYREVVSMLDTYYVSVPSGTSTFTVQVAFTGSPL